MLVTFGTGLDLPDKYLVKTRLDILLFKCVVRQICGQCVVMNFLFPSGVYVRTLNGIASIRCPLILTFLVHITFLSDEYW